MKNRKKVGPLMTKVANQFDVSNFDSKLTNQPPAMTPKHIGIHIYGKFPKINGYTYRHDDDFSVIKEDDNESYSSVG